MAYRSDRVAVTDRARNALRALIEDHGPVLLYLSSAATDDHAPDWLPAREFRAATDDVLFGRLAWHTELWMSPERCALFERKHLTVDVFAETDLAAPADVRFTIRARRLSASEAAEITTEAPRTTVQRRPLTSTGGSLSGRAGNADRVRASSAPAATPPAEPAAADRDSGTG
ncbi:hypothetical protein B0T36_07145 [Nocardia donostiensis]|uniref:DUF779 domain-containing protein n=1 Tax=Nocardia donostiensis TaxID=1538463 RepID=UPI0009D9AA99|nr:DUF779 domain-containing protein [Nocardia donostiensis]OQS15749.1 hypothetical protein B0T36_07145 [Nocardia donostiensis]